ncbi:hypothetical protein CEXT_328271 [Caerostris extrusa]|uniref:Uncharacterized protein n=1 Tax=Caerostris extrusa TaxID=172846 RepID=A0AAV4QM56_CAEEX|nr:hypothetical protein CEXT_328271 [Caerostris extrusa]
MGVDVKSVMFIYMNSRCQFTKSPLVSKSSIAKLFGSIARLGFNKIPILKKALDTPKGGVHFQDALTTRRTTS